MNLLKYRLDGGIRELLRHTHPKPIDDDYSCPFKRSGVSVKADKEASCDARDGDADDHVRDLILSAVSSRLHTHHGGVNTYIVPEFRNETPGNADCDNGRSDISHHVDSTMCSGYAVYGLKIERQIECQLQTCQLSCVTQNRNRTVLPICWQFQE